MFVVDVYLYKQVDTPYYYIVSESTSILDDLIK